MPPVYSEVIPLESNYRNNDYQVRVRYPEWKALTAQETAVIERYADKIADTLCINTFVGVSRGHGMLDLAFIPIVRQGDHYAKLLSGKIEIVSTPKAKRLKTRADDVATQRWASRSVLDSCRWVKISVQSDGIYYLTHSQLSAMGFSNPANCRVYGYGGHLQPELIDADNDFDDLEPVSLLAVPDGFLFFANGLETFRNGKHVVNHYARSACYFVTEASTPFGSFPSEETTTTAGTDITSFAAYASYNPQEYAWFQGGRQLYENYDYANGNSRNYSLSLPSYPLSDKQGKLSVNFSAANNSKTQVNTTFNGVSLGQMNLTALGDYAFATENEVSFTTASVQTDNSVKFTTTSGNHARLNYFTLSYEGQLTIDGKYQQITFSYQPEKADEVFCLSYANGQQPQVWRLAERGAPATALVGTTTTSEGQAVYRVGVPADGFEHRYVAFDAAAYASYPQPTIVGEVGNQNLHGLQATDMVIITPSSGIFDAQAERLAQAHREVDGIKVVIVRADQIYNEFSSGTPDATAYRRFMKMFYDRAESDATKPRYLLLFGDCAFDNRMLTTNWQNCDPDDFLLCFESENSISDVLCYVMEDYFGLLDDGEGANLLREKTDLGVGRFPVRNLVEAEGVVNKALSYINGEQVGAWKNIVCVMGDDGDANDHLKKADIVANDIENAYPQFEVRKVMWDAYKREVTASGNRYPQVEEIIHKQMEEGALLMNYVGHGSTYILSHEQVIRISDFQNSNTPRMPLWFTAACDVMPFDTQVDNIGETAFLNPNGGALAFIGTARTVYAYKNLELNRRFAKTLFDNDELGRANRLGDAMRICKALQAESDIFNAENKLHYAILGDPALTFGSVKNEVVLDSINGTAVDELPDDFMLHAGGKAVLRGHIQNEEGNKLDTFQGTLTVRFYDSRSTITCLNNNGDAAGPFTFEAYDKILYNGQDSIRNGSFGLTCPIPVDIHYSNEAGRLIFYAVGNDRITEARGYSEDFLLGGTDPELKVNDGPKILAYLNDENFVNGQTVNASPFFIAHLEDSTGINAAGNGLGHDLELIIDGSPALTYNLNDYYVNEFGEYMRGHLTFSIPTLSEGPHKLLFRAWNTVNKSSTTSLDFNVDPSLNPNILSCITTVNPARTQTQFIVNYDRPGCECTFSIDIFDFAGRLLWTHTETGSNDSGYYVIPWNLTTGAGFPLGSGVYLYRVRLQCDSSEEVSEAQKLIINRRQ